ncbi:hypothetical protein [Clostridium sp. UBA2485]|nr:hypothetical protein [Clostridium sp. UBA2485]
MLVYFISDKASDSAHSGAMGGFCKRSMMGNRLTYWSIILLQMP